MEEEIRMVEIKDALEELSVCDALHEIIAVRNDILYFRLDREKLRELLVKVDEVLCVFSALELVL